MARQFTSFRDFYPHYLRQHQNPACRRLHLAGAVLAVITLVTTLVTGRWRLLLLLPVWGYGFAWLGHWLFERNSPPTLRHPLYSFIADWRMLLDMLTGRLGL